MKSHEGGYPGTNATRVAIAILLSQAFLAEWLMRKLTLLYDGPGAGLVKCNLMIAGIALIPLFLGIMYVVCRLTSNVLGDIAAVPALIASLLLAGIAEICRSLSSAAGRCVCPASSRRAGDSVAGKKGDCRHCSGRTFGDGCHRRHALPGISERSF